MTTVLGIIQRVATDIGVKVPSAVFSSTERTQRELRDLCNEIAERITREYPWQALMVERTDTGDGVAESFALPSDFSQMPKMQQVWSSRIQTPLTHITDLNRWLEIDVRQTDYVVGVWTRYGGRMHIKPTMAAGETARYFYTSKNYGLSDSGAQKDYFTADDDTFRLDERLLRLGMVWQWKANKNLPYAEHMTNYEAHKATLIADDRGPRIMTIGTRRLPKGTTLSYPEAIQP